MKQAPDAPLDSKVLAWLITHPKWKKSALADSLAKFIDGGRSAASNVISEAIDRLKASGRIDKKRIALTDSGRRRALEILAVSELPQRPKPDWNWAKKRLSLQALDIPITAAALHDASSMDWLVANLLAQTHGITLRSSDISLDRVITELTWRALGASSGGERNGAKAFWAMVLRQTAVPSEQRAIEPPQTSSKNGTDLATFASAVNDAARTAPTGRWHDSKVFISHVWEAFRRKRNPDGMTYPQFQQRLVEAHRARLVRLGRADLVEAMPQADVQASETPYLNGTFHFVRLVEG